MALSNGRKSATDSSNTEDYQIALWEEKLKIVRHKQKVGEVIVRKHIEQKVVTIPIRREKLIVERVAKNPEQLTEVILSEERVNGFSYSEVDNNSTLESNKSDFVSLKDARQLLTAVEELELTGNIKIRLEIVSNNLEDNAKIKASCDRS